jgi:hypothetical protein
MNGATYTRPAVNHSTPSPGLATYRAPEELSDPEYFGHQSVPPVRTPVIGSSAAGGADVKGKGREVEEPETRADPGPANEVGNVPPPVQAPNVDGAAAEGGAPADGAEAGEDAAAEVGEDDMDGALEGMMDLIGVIAMSDICLLYSNWNERTAEDGTSERAFSMRFLVKSLIPDRFVI